MRALFFILLILNIGYFGWQFVRSPSDVATNMPGLNGVEPIVLLSEVKAAQLLAVKEKEAKEKAAELQAVAAELQAVKEKEARDKAAELQAAKAKESKEKEAELRAAKEEEVKEKAAELQAAKEREVKEKEAELQAAKEKEAKEKAEKLQAVKEKEVKEKAAKAAAAALAPDKCFTMGPFQDLENLRGLARSIKSYVVEVDFRGVEESGPPLYWVYTAAEKTKKATLGVVARLRAKKIKDFYVLHSEDKVNSISLGRFRNKKGVQKFVKKLEGLGFNVVVELIVKDEILYWLDYRVAAGNTIPESIFKKFKPLKEQKVNRSSRQCV